jgi:hypothetical protein
LSRPGFRPRGTPRADKSPPGNADEWVGGGDFVTVDRVDLDYGATFEAAVAAIDQTCDDFDPAG